MDDTLALALDGQISLDDFAAAVARFRGIVASLARDTPGGAGITWEVSGLQASSAIAEVRGVGPDQDVAQVVRAYERLGQALERHDTASVPASVRRDAKGLLRLIGRGSIESMRLETAREEHLVRPEVEVVETEVIEFPRHALGAVRGTVDTLSRRGGLKFTLYDLMHNRAISCYLPADSESEAIMRDAWGKTAIVYGRISRDPATGRPLSIRDVTAVETLGSKGPGAWREAEGAAPPVEEDDLSPEAAIRLIRDA